ncbi:MAG: diaminopimelate epimerase [Cyclobacteriaceae bacterium]
MSKILFSKYQGTGNDFIFIDNRNKIFDDNNLQLVSRLCDRKFGIGADGLVLIEDHAEADFEMIYFNPDGSQSFCGNAGRCTTKFARKIGLITDKANFLAIDGMHEAFIQDDLVHLKMGDVEKIQDLSPDYFLNTGSPHYIRFVDGLADYPVYEKGRSIRYSDSYAEKGTNVNFVQLHEENSVSVRTYERGVENETLSCGTGVTAVALAVSIKNYKSPVEVKTKGGNLKVSFTRQNSLFTNIYLIGPAQLVFEGQIEV